MCGVIGVYSPAADVALAAQRALFALQHRGEEAAGLAVGDGRRVVTRRDRGLVTQVLAGAPASDTRGFVAAGHTRYATAGSTAARNAQPVPLEHPLLGPAALAHNGHLTNTRLLHRLVDAGGGSAATDLDTGLLARLIERTAGDTWPDVLGRAFQHVVGAYSCVVVTAGSVIAARDPHGFRPLCLGRTGGRALVVASESCALDAVGADLVREVRPGELVQLDHRGLTSTQFQPSTRLALCSFEFIYFGRGDSVIDGCELEGARLRMGAELAREAPAAADVVIGLPDSGVPAALGFAEASGITYRAGLTRSRYVTRTFIQPDQPLREERVERKFNPIRGSLRGRRVVLVDDSLVRGTTCRRVVAMLREAGAAEVHLRIASPPLRFPCYMGIDIGRYEELIAAGRTVREVCEHVAADSLAYLSIAGLMRAVGSPSAAGYCRACFDGAYPIPTPADEAAPVAAS